jgi:MFS family permease
MRKALNLVVFLLSAVVGAWVGYWIGDALGWTKNAEFPWRFGGGTGAILLAFAMSVVFVAFAYVVLLYLPGRKVRQALENGVPARGRVVSIETTGEQSATKDGTYDRVRCEIEVRPRGEEPYRAQVLQFLTPRYVQSLKPGVAIQVRYDPSQRSRVAIIEPDSRRR